MEEGRQMEKLAAKAIKGNAKAYGQLIEYYKEYLYKTAWLSVRNQETALDIVGECILKGFHFIHTLKKPEYFKTWLTRILLNIAKDYHRKYPDTEDIETLQIPAAEDGISHEEKMDLYRAIELLPEKYKTVILLKYFNDMKISEIAYAMDVPEGSVKAYLNRAKKELRLILKEDRCYEDGISGYSNT